MNRCIRATKSFFLLSPEGNLYTEINSHAYLNGKIISVPRKGITDYKIIWDTSFLLHLVIDESKLRCSISREHKDAVSCLKRAHVLFDEVYPGGPTTGLLSVDKPKAKKKVSQKTVQGSQQSTVPATNVSVKRPTMMNQ
jgi:hypothetical protein